MSSLLRSFLSLSRNEAKKWDAIQGPCGLAVVVAWVVAFQLAGCLTSNVCFGRTLAFWIYAFTSDYDDKVG